MGFNFHKVHHLSLLLSLFPGQVSDFSHSLLDSSLTSQSLSQSGARGDWLDRDEILDLGIQTTILEIQICPQLKVLALTMNAHHHQLNLPERKFLSILLFVIFFIFNVLERQTVGLQYEEIFETYIMKILFLEIIVFCQITY